MADIFISYKRGTDEPQVEAIVGGLRGAHDVTVRDNNLTACAASHAIRAPAPNMHLILDNTGARFASA